MPCFHNGEFSLTWICCQYGVFVFGTVCHVSIMHDTAVIVGYAIGACSLDFVKVEFSKGLEINVVFFNSEVK